jgi:hypothetical protein
MARSVSTSSPNVARPIGARLAVVDVHDFPTVGAYEAPADEVVIQDGRAGDDSAGAHAFARMCTKHGDFLSSEREGLGAQLGCWQ